ncbi:putative triacylglyceride transporter [Mycolicibacter terrae]|uniref:MFS-type drug efflux transporter P55 n=1 Tax=Mycolicibacter terrae TaxID=1788 RepID=A0AAD1MH74_9MYCO|nr:MFS transporter [Mycolicibacter terrae]ORW96882.1 MFS transporter [Mycolicibacter terrae]BBX22436.1 putative triacylglyceride transporter [Mycolicibacter terrae]SNV75451.1 aminoglycosides/tetracycline-transport integral membrane protein [Mycolicibacter terrae]
MRVNRRLAISAGSLAVLLGALDTYVVVTIMRDIMAPQPAGVGIPINKIQQLTPIITCYLLGYIAAMPLLGRASDRFGRKLLLQVSLTTFAVGSVVTAMSTDLSMLVVGRTIQGVASGALLPVTLALGADLWSRRNRAGVLGGIGAAQELGSVLGPLYGIFIVWALRDWRDVFWINVPLTAIAMLMIHFSLPSRAESADDGTPPERVDVVGGLLLALALGLAVVGLYNPEPNAKQALPDWGLPVLGAALVATVAFAVWERFARTKLIDPTGARFGPFLAALGASVCAGAALMVTLVDVELFGQGVLGMTQNEAAGLLLRFLIALPVGAMVGGWIATRAGDRAVTFAGLLIAAGGYWLISKWPVDLLAYRHDFFGLFSLPALDTDQMMAGFGLGLVIGPLTSAVMRAVPPREHGIAASGVVVARMTGMLVGMAALSAWGLYRFNQILAGIPKVPGGSLAEKMAATAHNSKLAFAMMYGEIFGITAIVCVVGAVLGLFIGSNKHFAEDAELPEPEASLSR